MTYKENFIVDIDNVLQDTICDCVVDDALSTGRRAKEVGHNMFYFPLQKKLRKQSGGYEHPDLLARCVKRLEEVMLWPAYMELCYFKDIKCKQSFNMLCVDTYFKSLKRESTRGPLFFDRNRDKSLNILANILHMTVKVLTPVFYAIIILLAAATSPFWIIPAAIISAILIEMRIIE